MKNTANTLDENSVITMEMDEANKGNELDEKVQKINALHKELTGLQNQGKQITISIGEQLSTLWDKLPYSEIDDWTKNNLAFSERTARQYMGLFAKKDKELWQNFKF
jgi:hypothetical protein